MSARWITKRSSVTATIANAFTSNKERHENALLEGSLWKRKSTGRGWGRYWFELSTNGILKSYGKLRIGSSNETFNIFDIKSIKSEKLTGNPLPHQPNCIFFTLRNSSVTWTLAANTETEYLYWINNIKLILLSDSRYTDDYSDSESEEDEEDETDDSEDFNLINQSNFIPLSTDPLCVSTFDNLISDKLMDDLYLQYFNIKRREIFYEGEIYRLTSSLELTNSILQQKIQAESNLRNQFERLQLTLDSTNDRLHRAMSELIKYQNSNVSVSKTGNKDIIVDFTYLLQTRDEEFLLWLGIFPSDLPEPPNKINTTKEKNDIVKKQFNEFISDSSVIQVRLLKKYLAELVLGYFAYMKLKVQFIEEKTKFERYIKKETIKQTKKQQYYDNLIQTKSKQIEDSLSIIMKQKNICEELYDNIKYIKEENEKLKKQIKQQNKIKESILQHSINDNPEKVLLLTSKILKLQEELKFKNDIIRELNQECINEQMNVRTIFSYILYFVIIIVVFSLGLITF